jgi:hydroxypyruvate reductase
MERGARGELAETPKPGDIAFQPIRHQVVASGACSVAAMAAEAERAGFEVAREERPIVGEARDAAAQRILALPPGSPRRVALVSGGETTVTVRGAGRGGRNQELALAFALLAEREPERLAGRTWCFLSAGTDGVDGPTDAAGALVDDASLQRCRAAGVDPVAALADNDSYRALAAAGDLLRTGPTGTNVADLQVLLVEPS